MAELATTTDGNPHVPSDFRKLLNAARTGGIGSAAVHAVRVLAYRLALAKFDRDLDRLLQADTASVIGVDDLDLAGPNRQFATYYDPTRGRMLSFMLRDIPEDFSRFTFIDVGSGKGRILCAASRFGFRRVVGLELSRQLHLEAARNLETMLRRGDPVCRDLASINVDVTEFEFPREDLVIYMYNPFMGEVLEKMIRNLRRCWDGEKKIYVVYYHPLHREVLDECEFLRPVRRPMSSRLLHPVLSSAEVAIYRAVGQGQVSPAAVTD